MEPVTVIGAGLAGSECAVQLARRGIPVRLCEMKPLRRSPAHRTDGPAELVCSNSFRSDSPDTPIGLLHAELRRLGSVILGEADRARVPAGEALAVDRERFSAGVERVLVSAPGLERMVGEVESLPAGDVVVATGPLTSEALTGALSGWTGNKLYFYDSIAPSWRRSPSTGKKSSGPPATGPGTTTSTAARRVEYRTFVRLLGGEGAARSRSPGT
jgi:methylenetetrahydrofolate--tRNA-(uracil-5-)-methyltransferase